MRRLAAVALAAAVAFTGFSALPSAAAPVPVPTKTTITASSSSSGYTPPAIRWTTCADHFLAANGIQCGFLIVPLDYANPRGQKIKLAVSRLKHRSAASAYQGVMLVNPGGPGGSGLNLSYLGRGDFVPGTGDDDYDWIGFDPRGVGASQPALTCDGSYAGYDRPNYVPTTQALETAWLTKADRYAKACRDSEASRLLPHVKTTDTVKDMDSIRKALGQSQINFYGFSYGTYLGQVYATTYPSRVRRFVLDSNVDPRGVWYQDNLDQDRAFEKTINVWFGWLAKYDSVFHLGKSADIVSATYYRELAKLDAKPAAGVIGPDELNDVLTNAAYYVFGWVEIGKAFSKLINNHDATGIKNMYDGANPQTAGSDNGYAMYLATECSDAPWPKSFSTWRTDNWRVFAKAPFLTWNNAWFNMPCRTWPAKSATPVQVTGKNVTSKILLIDETLDPATPYSGSLEVRRLFPTASLIEGVGGTTHAGSLSGVACTDDAIGAYLTNGTVPTRLSGNRSDLKCPPVPQPNPTAASSLLAAAPSAAGTTEQVRAMLNQRRSRMPGR